MTSSCLHFLAYFCSFVSRGSFSSSKSLLNVKGGMLCYVLVIVPDEADKKWTNCPVHIRLSNCFQL